MKELLENCSDQTLYFRYFRLIKKFPHSFLIRFTQNDYDRKIGLAAFGTPPGPEVMMGVGRWRQAARKARVNVTCYEGTRHSLASQAINRGVSERIVGDMLGHKTRSSTRR